MRGYVQFNKYTHTLTHDFLLCCRTKSSGSDGVPSRPEAERPQAEMRRPSNPFAGGPLGGGWGGFGGVGGIEGGMAGGQLHFQAGLGFFPSLFGLQFVSI